MPHDPDHKDSQPDQLKRSNLSLAIHSLRTAETRIKDAARKCSKHLNLSGLSLSVLPKTLYELTELQHLDVSKNVIAELPESIGNLRNLRSLTFAHNLVPAIPESFGALINLQHFDISHNYLTLLPECIGQLTQLQYLNVSNNQLPALVTSLGQLTQLRYLYVNDNRLISLPESLKQLTALNRFHLRNNEQLGLPPELLDPTLQGQGEQTNPSVSPAAILEYYFRTRQARRPLNETKLILVGRGGAGKTCILKKLIFGSFNEHEPETPGIEIQQWPITLSNGETVRLHIWDFGGQEILHATHQFFLTERTLYLLVLSGREGTATQDAEYWLQLIKSFGNDSRVLIALNKSTQHPFDVNRGLLLEKYPFIADFIKTDCKDGIGMAALHKMIANHTESMEHRKYAFPADWFSIKEHLSGMQENFVTWDRYQAICRMHGEHDTEAQRHLASFLHILGIALNYKDDPRLKDTHVLNPRWVTEGIYALLRAGQKEPSDGILSRRILGSVLDSKKYPSTHHDFLIRLMEKFQLCFELPDRSDHYLVPELLGENQPDIRSLLTSPGLGFRYQYEILPEGSLPRFIVQTHVYSEPNPQWRWRTGVVLHFDGCFGVVRADVRERRIDIHIIGNEAQRRGLLAIIRIEFDKQHRALKGLNVDERVPISGEPGVTISYRHLLAMEEDGEEWCRPEGGRQKLRISDLLYGIGKPAKSSTGQHHNPTLPSTVNNTKKANVFISYSHKDQLFLDELRIHFKPYERLTGFTLWCDRDIAAGSKWLEEIQVERDSAKVVVMLASPDFLASDFIHEYELGPLLTAAASTAIRIIWVPVRHCSHRQTALKDYQAAISTEYPLASMNPSERDAAWVKVCEEIVKVLDFQIDRSKLR